MASYFNKNFGNYFLNQIHSNRVVLGSDLKEGNKVSADGIFCDKFNQNLWIYTADCMPILFADKRRRFVASVHCGRKGLEKKIIKNSIKIFDELGSSRNDILVAIGPSISKQNYLIDKNTFEKFSKNTGNKELITPSFNTADQFKLNSLENSKNQALITLDLKRNAHIQLLNENIPNTNIDISSLCTFELKNEFNSWRRSKTSSRQWSFISTKLK